MFILRDANNTIFDIVRTADEAAHGLLTYDGRQYELVQVDGGHDLLYTSRRSTPWHLASRLAAGPFRTNAAALAEVISGDWYGLSAEDLPGVTVEHIGDKVRATVEIIAPDGKSGATRRKSFDKYWDAYAFVQDLLDQAAAGDDE